ncbi:MAG: DUF493 domain-containing protein [Arenicellales bacterium]|jgi:hypothetical protein|nr:DUF493 domain-containing protein [Arenicellales bacterium]MDP6553006.1 DUF493 domain-containing protein [Arenicellales bacterium]MDP6792338.1 DUF493 domain-containing protein [Arenicellales bacterium]MDP6919844.1 DUF493 domain-containing protein [Arenicellales bacterium]|tara:strand:- start:1664 stop:1951 length:288 start_codon:yes stop_codon:yes gene_type:complete
MPVEDEGATISEELLNFPCEFQIKAMGKQVLGFDQRVRAIVSRHLAGARILDLSTRESGSSKYVSVSCTIEATSREQLDAIYMDLNSESDILLTL